MLRRPHLLMLLAAVTLALGLQACAPKAQESCNFVQNSYGQRVSWFQIEPIVMKIDNGVPSQALEPIQKAMETWNNALGYQVFKFGGWVDGRSPAKDGSNIIYWISQWDPARTFEQARTTIFWYDSQIYEADIKINAEHFRYTYGDEPLVGYVDLESLVLHELGHVLGLAHPADATHSVMNPYLRSSSLRREPMAMDLASLSCEYRVASSE